jgi:hypothetical protein
VLALGRKRKCHQLHVGERAKKVAHTDHSGAILTFIDGLSERASSSEELRRIYFYSMPVGMREIEIFRPQQKPNGIYSLRTERLHRLGQQKAPVLAPGDEMSSV